MIKKLSKTICILLSAAMVMTSADYVSAAEVGEAYYTEVSDGAGKTAEAADADSGTPANEGTITDEGTPTNEDTPADGDSLTNEELTADEDAPDGEDAPADKDSITDEEPVTEDDLLPDAELLMDEEEIQDVVDSGSCGENLTYSVEKLVSSDPDYKLTISGTGEMDGFTAFTIPWKNSLKTAQHVQLVIDEGVTSIGERAFSGIAISGEVTIPASVKHIGMSSFLNNTKLTKIYLASGSNLEIIDDYAFSGCTLLSNELELPASLTKIGDGAFQNCTYLQGGFAPGSNLKSVGKRAFAGCSGLGGDLVPGENLETIGDEAFKGCSNLKSTTELVFDGALTKIGANAFEGCSSLKGDLKVNGQALTVASNAFLKCTGFNGSLIIGDDVKMIAANAFNGCALINKDIIIGNGVEVIGSKAFAGITRVNGSLIIGRSLTSVASDAFDSISPKIVINNSDKIITIPGKQFISCEDHKTVTNMGYGRFFTSSSSSCRYITLDANGGSVEGSSSYDFPYIGKLGGLEGIDVKRAHCVFEGWYTEKAGGTLMTGTSTVPAGVDRLYAHWTITIVGTVEDPTANVASGSEVEKGTSIKLSTATEDAKIFYTLDGSVPTDESAVFDNAIKIKADTTIKAIAIKDCYTDSNVVTFTYTIMPEGYGEVDITDADAAGYTSPDQIPERFWVAGITDMPYTGSKITLPDIHVYYAKKKLTQGKDYTISYSANVNVGTAEVKITGRGNYDGVLTRNFAITPSDIATELVFNDIILSYDAAKPVRQNGIPKEIFDKNGKAVSLRLDKDYYCTYPDNTAGAYINQGEYQVIINGKGNYTGSVTLKEIITTRYNIAGATVGSIKNAKHTGSPIEPEVVVKYKGSLVSPDNYTVTYDNNTDIGKATVIITGKNNFIGIKKAEFNIVGTTLAEVKYLGYVSSYPYTGSAVDQAGYFYDANQGKVLVCGSDYTVEYSDNVSPGQATVIYTGINGYSGTKKVTYSIVGAAFNKARVRMNIDISKINVVFCGKPVELKEQGYDYELSYVESIGASPVTLTEGIDYSVSYVNNRNVGTGAMIKFTGMGKYQGSFFEKFTISRFNLTEKENNTDPIQVKITVAASYPYMKNGSEPVPVVQLVKGDEVIFTLTKDVDFFMRYYNNTKVNYIESKKPAMVIQGKGNFGGKAARLFDMTAADLSNVSMTATDIPYQNKAGICKTKVTITDLNGKKLVSGVDYKADFTYRYDEDVAVKQQRSGGTTVTVTRRKGDKVDAKDIIPARAKIRVGATGINAYKGSKSTVITYLATDFSKVSVEVADQYYTGKAIEPDKNDITVRYNGVQLTNEEYDIVGYSNNIEQGVAKVTISGKGDYSGNKTVNFKILKRSMYYLVTFRANGGTGRMPALSVVKDGTALKANVYKKEGNTFTGWNTHEDGSGDSVADKAALNLTAKEGTVVVLYAQWEPSVYAITYNLDGGTNNAANPATYTYGTSVVLKDPEKTGYRFDGWHKDRAEGTAVKEIKAGQYGNVKLAARWKPISYYIVLDGNGGQTAAGATVDKNMATQVYGTAAALRANTFYNKGKNFRRWSTNRNGTGLTFKNRESVKNLTTDPWSTVTLYAQWVPDTITSSIAYGGDFIAPYSCKFNLKADDNKCLYSYTLTNKSTGIVTRRFQLNNCELSEIVRTEGFAGIPKGEYELVYSACPYTGEARTNANGYEHVVYVLDTGAKVTYKVNVIVE